MDPVIIQEGLALYRFGSGPEIFLMPYPHASSYRSTADGRYAKLLVKSGFSVITFDPPEFARSVRPAKSDLSEMFESTKECLRYFGINKSIPFTGHSMGGFCILAFVIENPDYASRLIISGSPSGWNDVWKYSIHKKWKAWEKKFWQSRYWGARIILNRASLKTHRQLDNLTNYECFHNKDFYEELEPGPDDHKMPPPPRAIWLRHVRKYDYEEKLHEIKIPVLVTAGRFDPLVPLEVSQKMKEMIPDAELAIFNNSGHSPFIEEPEKYSDRIIEFLSKNDQFATN